MDIVKIQTLIKQGRVVALSDIDPNESYLQIGVYQPGNRKIGPADPNAYAPFAIPLSEIGGGGGGTWGTITGLLSNQLDLQAVLNSKYDASNPSGYISGITGGDVTTALGYTPYDSTNPAGYITSASLSQVTFTTTIDLNTTSNQTIGIIPSGLYTTETAYVFNASTDLTVTSLDEIIVYNSGVTIVPPTVPPTTAGPIFSSKNILTPCPPPGCIDKVRNSLSTSQMVATLLNAQSCWPSPCNIFILNGGETLSVQINTATGVPATAKLHIILNKIG